MANTGDPSKPNVIYIYGRPRFFGQPRPNNPVPAKIETPKIATPKAETPVNWDLPSLNPSPNKTTKMENYYNSRPAKIKIDTTHPDYVPPQKAIDTKAIDTKSINTDFSELWSLLDFFKTN